MCFLGFLETAKALSKQNLAIELLEKFEDKEPAFEISLHMAEVIC